MWVSIAHGPKKLGWSPGLGLVLLALVLAAGEAGARDAGPDQSGPKPVVIAMDVARIPEARDLEEQFVTQLALALDGYELTRIDSEAPEFMGLPLSEQLRRIEKQMLEKAAIAAVWIEATESRVISLHLVVFSTGRALVRIVEIDEGPGAAKDLALAAQELLSQAYMFDTAPRSAPNPEPPAPPPAAPSSAEQAADGEDTRISYLLLGALQGGVFGHSGPSTVFGGGLGMEVWFSRQVILRAAMGISAGPRKPERQEEIRTWGLRPELTVGTDWRMDRFHIGPIIGAGATWNEFAITRGTGRKQTYSKWRFYGSAGLDMRLAVTGNLHIFADARVNAYAMREQFELEKSGDLIFSTPFVEWGVSIGTALFL